MLHILGRDWSGFFQGEVEIRAALHPNENIILASGREPIFYSKDQILDVVGDDRLLHPKGVK